MSSVYEQILEVTRRQAEAARTDDLGSAIALLDERGRLVAAAPTPSLADEALVREILQLDRDLATAMRHRMLAIRDEAMNTRHGQHALAGYSTHQRPAPQIFDLPA